jgi:hypothetical protein
MEGVQNQTYCCNINQLPASYLRETKSMHENVPRTTTAALLKIEAPSLDKANMDVKSAHVGMVLRVDIQATLSTTECLTKNNSS